MIDSHNKGSYNISGKVLALNTEDTQFPFLIKVKSTLHFISSFCYSVRDLINAASSLKGHATVIPV